MPHFRISTAARLLGVSDDTVRRWADQGLLVSNHDDAGRLVVDGASLAARARETAEAIPADGVSSARNRFVGLVTRVQMDGLMAQVDVQAGPFRVVSLMSREAAEDLRIEPGSLVTTVVKATQVTIERHDDV